MELATTATALLAGIGPSHLSRLKPADRAELRKELIRVYRIIEGDQIVADAAAAASALARREQKPQPKSGVLLCLNQGERSL
jgi:hypothetical protein